jgi:molybdopterin synthase sulfur carrier subunit
VLNIAVKRFGPQFESVLGSCRVWLNGESVEMHHRVGDGDEVAVLPPVSGGCQ